MNIYFDAGLINHHGYQSFVAAGVEPQYLPRKIRMMLAFVCIKQILALASIWFTLGFRR
jgi:hypothetical protein